MLFKAEWKQLLIKLKRNGIISLSNIESLHDDCIYNDME